MEWKTFRQLKFELWNAVLLLKTCLCTPTVVSGAKRWWPFDLSINFAEARLWACLQMDTTKADVNANVSTRIFTHVVTKSRQLPTCRRLIFFCFTRKAKEIGEVCMQVSRDFSSNEGKIMHCFIAIRLDANLRTIENIRNVDSSPAFYLLFVFSNNR